ncbi:hypothetical protein OIU83_08805 [Flavobacterium sp. LS1R49]|uniref:Uncharacterized protein n=1 Tax=Flavobacterium shii TaxID=2987687 RepID=A0A9X3C749_9FLAO|nr:hypothetical protein [Flavobacterium shii]MCV9927748.1 hypothetical protein [Flavobacterium shii]
MKKTFLLLAFLLMTLFHLSAQNLKIELQNIRTEEKVMTGSIDGKYPISVYLNFYNSSEDHMRIYSVKGWYYYENIKKKIPLVGIYDGGLTLYSFKTKEQQNQVLNFESKGTIWEKIDILKNLTGFDEKFSYSEDDKSGNEWTDGKKKLKLELFNQDISILKEYQLLNIKNPKINKNINLTDLGIYDRDFELVNFTNTATGTKILLKFDYNSRFNIQGMCGAGSEAGYTILNYDSNFSLITIQRAEIESCLNNVYYEEIKNDVKYIKKFKLSENGSDTKIAKTITINEKLIEIKTE